MKQPAHILFEKHLGELGISFEREFHFHDLRRWRFDYLLCEHLLAHSQVPKVTFAERHLAVEIEGAIWSRGRHTRGKGFQADLDKYNHATMMGYRVLRFSTEDVMRGRASAWTDYAGEERAPIVLRRVACP